MTGFQTAQQTRQSWQSAAAARSAELTAHNFSAATLRKPANAAAGPLPRSLAVRLASLAGALMATALLLGSQLGIVAGYSAEADARQLAAARSREVAQQQAGERGRHDSPQQGGKAALAPAPKKAT